ncbi:putative ribonuclease H-like domain-containing protein [Tanacetum coccineum]
MEFESAQSNTTAKLPILKLENGNSRVSVPQTTQENGTSVTKMSVPVTAEEKTNKKNEVKARSLLLMALPNEHQLTFSQYSDAKTMFVAIETRFGGNEATKKTQKTLLAILGVVITQEDLNSKFLRSLPPEWNTHVVYTSPNVSIVVLQVSTTSFSDNAVYAFMIKNPNGSNLLQQDLEKIHKDDLEAMDLKWQLSLLSMRQKGNVKHTRNKEGQFRNQDNTRKQGNNEDTSSKAMLAIDGVGFDWSDMVEEQAKAVNTARPKAVNTARPHSAVVNDVRVNQANAGKPQQDDTRFIDSGCSRHMTGNIAYLSDFKEFDGGYFTFGGGAHGGRISGKGTLKIAASTITNESADTQGELNADASYFDSPSKDVGNGEPKSVFDDQKQVEDGPDNENDEKDKSKDDSSPNEVNIAGQHVNTVSPEIEPTSNAKALSDSSWVETMQEELLNKKDEKGIMIRNKSGLVTQGHRQEEGIDYEDVFAHVARIEQKIVFSLFKDPDNPDKDVTRFKHFMIGLKATKTWYETLANYLLGNGFKRGKIDQTLFIKKQKGDILLVQVYVDDIIFGSTNKELYTGFEKLMKDKFQMISIGELTFFLRLQVQQKEDGIFISQDKYVDEVLKKFNYTNVKSASTLVDLEKPLVRWRC